MPADTKARIELLHEWYCQNVMRVRLTPEIERLWLEWITAGYNGPQLRTVIIYLRKQINVGKRNEGSVKLSNLFERAEDGSFRKFDEDLGLAGARGNLNIDKRLAPAPDVEGRDGAPAPSAPARAERRAPPTPPADPDAAQAAFEAFQAVKNDLR